MLPTNRLIAEILGGTYINIKNIIIFPKILYLLNEIEKKYINC